MVDTDTDGSTGESVESESDSDGSTSESDASTTGNDGSTTDNEGSTTESSESTTASTSESSESTSEGQPDTDNSACDMNLSFEIAAVDATDVDGFDPAVSMIGEGEVLAWDQQNQDAFISFDLDIPCDDTWHVWVRAIDQGSGDSFFAVVDGEPNPSAIFELDCTPGPAQPAYLWKELNLRNQADPTCTYLEDPWTHDWQTGVHNLTLVYRESNSVARIWLTNTDDPPP